jgi:hypothetical protein
MRYSYGIMDRRKILLYNPQLFLKGDDILTFSSKDFHKWHGNIKEYIDGLYQINSRNKSEPINTVDLNLALGVLGNITEELENLFDSKIASDLSYHYISTLDEKHKKRSFVYTSDMRRCDMRVPVITPSLKYQNLMEVVRYAENEFERVKEQCRIKRIDQNSRDQYKKKWKY